MKVLIFAFTLIVVSGFSSQKINNLKPHTYRLNLITLNSDTIYFKGQPRFTHRYNYKLLKNEEDSLKIRRISIKKYQECERMAITFETDTTFIMTKMRSGGRIFTAEKDTGSYVIKRDTIFMTNKTRNNYKEWFILKKPEDLIFSRDETSNGRMYWEYKKEK
jgi:hypothetical protein